jgi:hypothetical protein
MTKTNSTGRDARLAEALRTNLRRRKMKQPTDTIARNLDQKQPDPTA